MSFGIGAFPFGIFATAFNINDGRPPPGTMHPFCSESYHKQIFYKPFCNLNNLLNDKTC